MVEWLVASVWEIWITSLAPSYRDVGSAGEKYRYIDMYKNTKIGLDIANLEISLKFAYVWMDSLYSLMVVIVFFYCIMHTILMSETFNKTKAWIKIRKYQNITTTIIIFNLKTNSYLNSDKYSAYKLNIWKYIVFDVIIDTEYFVSIYQCIDIFSTIILSTSASIEAFSLYLASFFFDVWCLWMSISAQTKFN